MTDAPVVERFVADFESGLWQALRSVFDSPVIQGCAFHWGQAVWRKVQDLGLKVRILLYIILYFKRVLLPVFRQII